MELNTVDTRTTYMVVCTLGKYSLPWDYCRTNQLKIYDAYERFLKKVTVVPCLYPCTTVRDGS